MTLFDLNARPHWRSFLRSLVLNAVVPVGLWLTTSEAWQSLLSPEQAAVAALLAGAALRAVVPNLFGARN